MSGINAMGVKLAVGCYFGDCLQGRELAGFWLTDFTYQPGHRIPTHSHAQSYFSLIVAGGYEETYGNRNRTCQSATVVFHPAGERHAERIGCAGARVFSVEVVSHWLGASPEYRPVLEEPADFQGGPLARLAFRLYQEFRRPDTFSPLAVEGLVLECAAERARHGNRPACGRPPRWLTRAQEALRARFVAPPSLAELADEVGVHPVHLARTFRAYLGCTVGDYVRQLKVEYAGQRLTASEAPLVDIALDAGLADQSHFARTFRRLRGLTPTAFRLLHSSR
jgi:AraC family transcriptional regulator